jgi:hypothetical protein
MIRKTLIYLRGICVFASFESYAWLALLPAACSAASDHACVFSSDGDGAAMRGSGGASELLSKGGMLAREGAGVANDSKPAMLS